MVDFVCAGVRAWTRSWCVWATRTRRWSGTGAAGAACRSTSLPAASRSSRWMWRWRGSTRPCGFFGKEQAGTLKPTDVYLFRVAQMLGDYAVHGAVLRRYNRSVSKLDAVERRRRSPGSRAWLRAAGRSASTVRTYGTLAGEFVAFTGTRGGLACCDAGMIGAFVATLAGYQFKTVEQKLCAVRSFLRFASADGLVDGAVPGGGPGGTLGQAGQDPVGMGSRRGGQDPGSDRPGQPVRETGLRDHPADHQARAARHRHQAAGVRRLRLAGQPAVRGAGQDRSPGAAAAAERGRLGGDRLHPPRPAGQRLPAGVRAAHGPDRPVLRPGPSASDPGQARPGGARAGERETPPWHALAAAYAGDPADGRRHAGRADRRHPRSPVRRSRPAST